MPVINTSVYPPHGATAASKQGLVIVEDSCSHSDTPHSVELLWACDVPDEKNSTCHHTTITRDRHPCLQRDSKLQSQKANGCRLTP